MTQHELFDSDPHCPRCNGERIVVIDNEVFGCPACSRDTCNCGSLEFPEEVFDARGIFVAKVCSACRTERLRGYRPEIFTDPNYDAFEPIEEEL